MDAASAFDERMQALPHPGSLGFRVSRLSASAEPGSSLVVNYSKSCEDYDAFGPKECNVYYGTPVWKTVQIHLPSGLESGDIFHTSWDVIQTHNPSHWASPLVPKNIHMVSDCAFCENSCTLELTNYWINMTASFPTFLDKFELCNGTVELPEEEFTITNKTEKFIKPFDGLDLEGNITAGLGIFRPDGSTRVYGSWIYRMEPDAAAASLAEPAAAEDKALLAERVLGPMDLLQEVLLPQLLLDPAAELVEAFGLKDLPASAVASLRSLDGRRAATHAAEWNVTVRSLPPGSSFSLLSAECCNTTDGLGSATCRFPFNGTVDVTQALDIAFSAAEGSRLYVSTKFTPGGTFGTTFAHKFKKKEMNVPLCGTGLVTVLDVNNVPYPYKPWKCGDYSLRLDGVEPSTRTLADFDDFKLPVPPFVPLLPHTFNEVLPLRLEMEMEMNDTDSNTIASVAISAGLFLV